jgi:hypothetical protein
VIAGSGFLCLGIDIKENSLDMSSPATKCLRGTFDRVVEETNLVVKVCGALVDPGRFRSVVTSHP